MDAVDGVERGRQGQERGDQHGQTGTGTDEVGGRGGRGGQDGARGARWGELCYNALDPQTHRQEESTTVRRVLSFDPGSCTGCLSCMLNCALQHEGLNALSSARLVIEFDPFVAQWPAIYCRQCTRAPCAAACPVEAIRRHPSKEYWYIDYDACTGCRACVEACPFGACRDDPLTDKVLKCITCEGDPVCVRSCAAGALRNPIDDRRRPAGTEGGQS